MPDTQAAAHLHRHKFSTGSHGVTSDLAPPLAVSDTGTDSLPTAAQTQQTLVQTAPPSAAPPTSPSQASEIAFISGVNADGTIAATSFNSWNGDDPATYASYSYANKWGGASPSTGSAAGTAGGTVYYYFDPASNWTAGEEASFTAGFALWSAVANVTFVQTNSAGNENIEITRGAAGSGAYEESGFLYAPPVGTSVLYNQGSGSLNADGTSSGTIISIDTTQYGWSDLASITDAGGYDFDTIVHEEGHALGFGHDGPYNGTVDSAVQQYSAYDSRLWSLMSYIEPGDTTAKYYSDYTVTGTQWNGEDPTTWMPLDILSAQALYGVATSTPLDGGQVFGFNCNVAASINEFFNFAINVNPVCTLYDTGTDNTLDLSGYSTAETVNLNAGDFSSFDGMTNNMGIAYGTAIDNFVGGNGNDAITTNADADDITGGTGQNIVYFSGGHTAYTLARSGSTVTVHDTANGVTDTLVNIQTLSFADESLLTSDIPCFASGTRILTSRGEIAVENLAIGDILPTRFAGTQAIKWIGTRRVDVTRHKNPESVWPILIQPGALGEHQPARALRLSPGHALFVDGRLIHAASLVNGATITQERCDTVEYWHIELSSHDIIWAENLATESYLDIGDRTAFHNGGSFLALYPDFSPQYGAQPCVPFAQPDELRTARTALLARAEAFGHHLSAENDLHIIADGKRIAPLAFGTARRLFIIPENASDIRLKSRTFTPAHTGTRRNDQRCLGIAVTCLQLDGLTLPLRDDTAFGSGWHKLDANGHRCTTGITPVPANTRLVMLELAGHGLYWAEEMEGPVKKAVAF